MLAGQGGKLCAHLFRVQGVDDVGVGVAVERPGVGGGVNLIAVALAHGGEAGVEIVRHGAAFAHADVAGQHGIEGVGVLVRGDAAGGIEVGALAEGVDARVRAAGAKEHRPCPHQPGHGLLHHLLHGEGVLLPLPAGVGRAVVFEGEQYAHQNTPRALNSTITATSASSERPATPSFLPYFNWRMRVRPSPPW